MDLLRLSYVSTASPGLDEAGIARIVATAQHHNALHGVTGALLSYAGHFLQVLEGPRAAVEETYRHIAADARHRNLVLLESEPIGQRLFARWSMRHVPAPQAHDRAVSGFLGELARAPDAEHAHTALALLERLAQAT